MSRYLFVLIFLALCLSVASQAKGELIVDTGSFNFSDSNTGSHLVATSTFDLTASQIPHAQFMMDLLRIDDGICVTINGTPLFESFETSQFGPRDFVETDDQPNDIFDPWSPNSNGLPRLSVFSDSSGTMMSGTVDTSTNTIVDYDPVFAVADFSSLLVAGTNTIQFINHNATEGAGMDGSYSVILAVPEPCAATLGLVYLAGIASRRRRHALAAL